MRLWGLAWMLALLVLGPAASAAADTGPALSVDAASGRHAISPYIYGWNTPPADLAAQIDLPVDRRGGNAADTLNWKTGVENHSNDYFFENLPTCWPDCPAGWDPARSYTDQIDADRTAGSKSLIDLPMLGRVPKDFGDNNKVYCSFSVATYGAQTQTDPYAPDCGNGLAQGTGMPVANNPDDTGVSEPASFQGDWVSDLVGRYRSAANGGVAFYELGNEPGLWNSTHRDWHPSPVTYDELWSRSQALASEVKSRDPSAAVLAFSEWGWLNYFCSSADDLSDGCQAGDADRANHGGTPLVDWLLQQFKQWADDHGGQRLVDYLDVHYYRQDNGNAGFAATRSLWDPSYTDQSWIADKIRLIPRMHEWVDQNYPGTKIALSEYDLAFGSAAEDNLIQADVLGIFAREGMDLATLWPETSVDHYADAFRLFRNYDGAHSEFGDTYVSSQSADQSQLAIYGAQRSGDGALTLVVVNKTLSDLTSDVSLAGFTPASSAQAWRFTNVADGIKRVADQGVAAGGFSATFPARSMTLLVIPAAPAGTPASGSAGGDGAPVAQQPPSGGGAKTPAVECRVPKLRGLTLKRAKAKLQKAHCRLGRVARKRSHRRKGTVIAQTPKPKSVRRNGAKVRVVLSRGR